MKKQTFLAALGLILVLSLFVQCASSPHSTRTINAKDFTDDDGEFNDAPNFATPHPLEKRVTYSLSSLFDIDWYVLDIPVAGQLTVWTEGRLDTEIELYYDPTTEESMKRTLIGSDDDSGDQHNARVSEKVRAEKVYVQVTGSPGEYTLVAELK